MGPPCHYPATHWVDLTPATHWVDCQNLWYMGVGLITRFFLVSIIDMELLIHRVLFFSFILFFIFLRFSHTVVNSIILMSLLYLFTQLQGAC